MNRIRIVQNLQKIRRWLDSSNYLELLSKQSTLAVSNISCEIIDPHEPNLPYMVVKNGENTFFSLIAKAGFNNVEYWVSVNIGGFQIPIAADISVPMPSVLFMLASISLLNKSATLGNVTISVDEFGIPWIIYNVRVSWFQLCSPNAFAALIQKINYETANRLKVVQNMAVEEFNNEMAFSQEWDDQDDAAEEPQ